METTAAASTKNATPIAVVTTPAVLYPPAQEPGGSASPESCSAKAAELQAAVAALAAAEAAPEAPVRPRQAIVAARPGRPLGRQNFSRRSDGALQWQLNTNRELTIGKEALEYWGLAEEQRVCTWFQILDLIAAHFQHIVWHHMDPRSGPTSLGLPSNNVWVP